MRDVLQVNYTLRSSSGAKRNPEAVDVGIKDG
jgi:hypothetical protein